MTQRSVAALTKPHPMHAPTALNLALWALLAAPAALATTVENQQEIELSAIQVTAEQQAAAGDPQTQYNGEASRASAGLPLTVVETPQSVTVVTQKRMEDQQLTTVNEVLSQTAGVSVKEYDSARQYYYSRGFEITDLLIDGVPTLFDPGWGTGENNASTAMYKQVEIVKGATGLMSGSGSPAGAINLVRKRADSSEFSGTVALGAGNREQRNGSVDVASALNASHSLRGRAVVSHEQEDSFREIGSSQRSLLYLTSELDLTSSTLLTLGGSHQRDENDGATWGGLPIWYSDGTRSHYGRSDTTAADWTYWDSSYTNVFAELEQQLSSDWALHARVNHGITAGESRLLYVYGNADAVTGLGLQPWPGGHYDVESNYSAFDLFATGRFALLGQQHDATLGLARAEQKFAADYALATSTSPIGNFNQWDGHNYPEHVWGDSGLYEEYSDTQTALYGSSRLNITPALAAIVGARLTNQQLDYEPGDYVAEQQIKHNGILTPYAGLVYTFADHYSPYISYTDIFSPQNERDVNGDPLDPIIGKSYELGIKAGLLEQRLVASVALFRIEQDNLAVVDPGQVISGTTDQAYREAEGATSQGYELELSGAISDDWDLQLGWTDYEVEDAAGDKVNTEQPRRILKTFTSYQFPGALSQLTIGGGVNWESESYGMATNPVSGQAERVEQGSLTLVNLMARYQFTPALEGQLNLDNLSDEVYYTNIGTFGQIAYGTPRTLALSAAYKF